MSTAEEEHHPRQSAGQVFMALLAGALALMAAYLWLTDGAAPLSFPISLAPAEPPATPVAARPVAPAPLGPALSHPQVSRLADPPPPAAPPPVAPPAMDTPAGPVSPPSTPAAPPPPSLTAPIDPQVAADAAAVGMTSRVRPVDPASPGQ